MGGKGVWGKPFQNAVWACSRLVFRRGFGGTVVWRLVEEGGLGETSPSAAGWGRGGHPPQWRSAERFSASEGGMGVYPRVAV